MTENKHLRLRTLSDPDHLPALKPEYVYRRPALGLGEIDPPPRVLLLGASDQRGRLRQALLGP